MRYDFVELPGSPSRLPRPVIPVRIEDLDSAAHLFLVDTGSETNRVGKWVAESVGIDLAGAPTESIAIAGLTTTVHSARTTLTIAGFRYDAPVTFCDPWPFPFHVLGQEGFLRYFRLTMCAKEFWLDVEPEDG